MRLLWVSDSPATPSGFAAVTREVCSRLAARGHRIEILGWQTFGTTSWWQGIPVHPVRHDRFGADVLLGYLMRVRPDFVVTLADVWWMAHLADPQVQSYLDMSGARWVHYYPVDGADDRGLLPDGWNALLRVADVPVAMSRFGQQVSRAGGVDAGYVPHGVDLDVFAPPPDAAAKEASKRRLGYDRRFVVLSDARNQPRKLLPRTVDVMRLLAADARYDDVVLHLHCDPRDPAASSELYHYDVVADLEQRGLLDRVRFTADFRMRPGGGVAMTELAQLYRAADVHLLSSWGEGFGLPTLQAAAAGVVPIAADWSASRELVAGSPAEPGTAERATTPPHGVAVPVEATMRDEFGLVRALLGREHAAAAIAALHDHPDLLADRSRASRAFAAGYGWDDVADAWERTLAQAPPRRRPTRQTTVDLVAGRAGDTARSALDSALRPVAAALPDGARLQVRVTERLHGEAGGRIRREAFTAGHEISVPVRLPPALPGMRQAQVGWVLAGPASLPALAAAQQVLPSVQIAVTTPGLDIDTDERLDLETLVAALPAYTLVVDTGGDACPGLDLACAVLGVPYLGDSPWWMPVTGAEVRGDADAVRKLLTDQGHSARRRDVAHRAVLDALPAEVVQRFVALAVPDDAAARPEAVGV